MKNQAWYKYAGIFILLCLLTTGGAAWGDPGPEIRETETQNKDEQSLDEQSLDEQEAQRPVLPGYENTIWGVTGPDGRAVSGYTWEEYHASVRERARLQGIRVSFGGFAIDFPDQKPVIDRGRVLVPMRPVFESVHVQCRVIWDEEAGSVSVFDQRGRQIVFRPGESSYTVKWDDGEEEICPLDVPAAVINGRVLLPLRVLLEAYAYQVEWLAEEQVAYIEDTHPGWRDLMEAEEWEAALAEACSPCVLVKEAP